MRLLVSYSTKSKLCRLHQSVLFIFLVGNWRFNCYIFWFSLWQHLWLCRSTEIYAFHESKYRGIFSPSKTGTAMAIPAVPLPLAPILLQHCYLCYYSHEDILLPFATCHCDWVVSPQHVKLWLLYGMLYSAINTAIAYRDILFLFAACDFDWIFFMHSFWTVTLDFFY